MPEKTVSQKIARVFEIADYILLVPSTLGLAASLILGGGAIAVFTIYVGGVVLLVGYFKHSRGKLSAGGVRALWIGTILFNGLFLAPSLYFIFRSGTETNSQNNLNEIIFSPYGWLLIWWTLAVGGAIIALGDYKEKTKFI